MIKKINLTKMKFLIAAIAILSVISINAFSAPKVKETKKIEVKKAEQKKIEWKQISLEPDLDGDGIKDKIDVDYAVDGNNVHLKFTPYIFSEKAKFVKGKSVEKVISKSEFEAKFDTFIKGFIAEYPKKSGVSPKPKQNTQTPISEKQEITKPSTTPGTKINNENKKPTLQNDTQKNNKNIKNNTESQETIDMKKEDNPKGNTKIETPKNSNSQNGSHSYIKEFSAQRPKNLTFNFQYDKNSPKDMDEFIFIKTATSIKKEPNSSSKTIKSASYSQKYKTTGIVGNKSDEWYEIFFDNQLGYIPKSAAEKREFDWNDMMNKVEKTNKFINEALSANKKLYVLDDYTPLGGGENGKRDKFGNRANQSEFGYLDKTFKDYINIPDRTIMVIDEQNDKYIKVKIDAYDNGIYYLKPSTGKYLKDAGITGEITRFIYVDRASQNEMVIEKSGNNWNVVTSSFVTTGKDSGNSFATPYGTFLIAYSKPVMQYTGSDNKTVVGDAKNAVRFSGGGYMHSIPSLFEPKNTREQRKAATAKKIGTYPESHKCIRHYDDQIKFIYDWLGNSTPGHKEGYRVPSVPTVMLVK